MNTPELIEAVKTGNLTSLSACLNQNGSVDAVEENGSTALMWAAHLGKSEVVQILLEHGASVFIEDPVGQNALTWASYGEDANDESIRRLREAGSPVTMIAAARLGDNGAIEQMIHKGYNINQTPHYGITPLLAAVDTGQAETVSLLLSFGADTEASDDLGTALAKAAQNGYFTIAERLIEHGARVNSHGNLGSPLSYASANAHSDIVLLLFQHGAEVNSTDMVGYTPLMDAAARGQFAVVNMLIEHGADPKYQNEDGNSAIKQARINGSKNIVRFLKSLN